MSGTLKNFLSGRIKDHNPLIIIDNDNGIHGRMDDACELLLNRLQTVPGFLMHRLDGSQLCQFLSEQINFVMKVWGS
jgi:hypothetical protein